MKALKTVSLVLATAVLASFDKPITLVDTPTNFKHQVQAKVKPFKKGEKISYFLHYGVISAGEATLTIKRQDTSIHNNAVFHMVGEGKTISVFEWFYKVRDVYETYLDEGSLAPRKFKRRVNEGG